MRSGLLGWSVELLPSRLIRGMNGHGGKMLMCAKTGEPVSKWVDARLLSSDFWQSEEAAALELVAELARDARGGFDVVARNFLECVESSKFESDSFELPDCILALGNALEPGGGMSSELAGRMRRVLLLHGRHPRVPIVLSGGGGGDLAEARAMEGWLRVRGVSSAAVWLEDKSMDTVENARLSWPILDSLGARRVALVTGRGHMDRAAGVLGIHAKRAGRALDIRREAWDPKARGGLELDGGKRSLEAFLLFKDIGRVCGAWEYEAAKPPA